MAKSYPIHPTNLPLDKLLEDCEIKKTRRGGPGGQHRNKVESAIVITHQPSGIIGQAGERRSQHDNRRIAIGRLRINLAIGVRSTKAYCADSTVEPIDKLRKPSPLWIARTRGQKISVSPEHDDFPAVLAEALDFIDDSGFNIPVAADRLNISNSQLVKFIKTTPAAFIWLNENRESRGMGKLK